MTEDMIFRNESVREDASKGCKRISLFAEDYHLPTEGASGAIQPV